MGVTKWIIDPSHSEIRFKVKHLMISTVTGSFISFDGFINSCDDRFNKGKEMEFQAEVRSLFTNNTERDVHLRSPDFFDVDLYPKIIFSASYFELKKGELAGKLTIKGTTRQIRLKVKTGGIAKDAQGQLRAGISIQGKVNRKAFGLTWNDLTHAGNVVVGDEVLLLAELQLIKVDI